MPLTLITPPYAQPVTRRSGNHFVNALQGAVVIVSGHKNDRHATHLAEPSCCFDSRTSPAEINIHNHHVRRVAFG